MTSGESAIISWFLAVLCLWMARNLADDVSARRVEALEKSIERQVESLKGQVELQGEVLKGQVKLQGEASKWQGEALKQQVKALEKSIEQQSLKETVKAHRSAL
ncbi:hypothetical protein BASA81_002450 [Batrachochytrium salamandrivorans]|nr:hypothetical protein BASA81_002450 [Batrachochytrium salamandrivorans]